MSRAKSYKDSQGRDVYQRLYKQGIDKTTEQHNIYAESLKTKLNISTRPWEGTRSPEGGNKWAQSKTHLPKHVKSIDDYLWKPADELNSSFSSDTNAPPFAIIEYNESSSAIWHFLEQTNLLKKEGSQKL